MAGTISITTRIKSGMMGYCFDVEKNLANPAALPFGQDFSGRCCCSRLCCGMWSLIRPRGVLRLETMGGLVVANSRIEVRVHHIYQQVDEDVEGCKQDHHRLNHREVAVSNGVNGKTAQPRPRRIRSRLPQTRSTYGADEPHISEWDDQGVSEAVLPDDLPLGHALDAGEFDVLRCPELPTSTNG